MATAAMFRAGSALMLDKTTVTFKNQTTPGVYASTPARGCWIRNVKVHEAGESKGVYVVRTAKWFLPKTQVPTQPTPADIVSLATPSSTRSVFYSLGGDWLVMGGDGVTEAGARGVWVCSCAMYSLQGGLTTVANIRRPIVAIGDGGRLVNSGTTLIATNINVRIQIVGSQTESIMGKLTQPTRAVCYLPANVNVDAHDWVLDNQDNIWSVVGDKNYDELGILQTLDLELLL